MTQISCVSDLGRYHLYLTAADIICNRQRQILHVFDRGGFCMYLSGKYHLYQMESDIKYIWWSLLLCVPDGGRYHMWLRQITQELNRGRYHRYLMEIDITSKWWRQVSDGDRYVWYLMEASIEGTWQRQVTWVFDTDSRVGKKHNSLKKVNISRLKWIKPDKILFFQRPCFF